MLSLTVTVQHFEELPGCFPQWPLQQHRRGPVAPQPHQLWLLSVFLIVAILIGVRWYLMVLICISLITNDLEHLFLCFLAILQKCPLESFAHFKIGFFVCFKDFIFE